MKMTEFNKIKDDNLGNISRDYESSDSHVIRFGEFFRNDLMILLFGYSLAIFMFIAEILFLYLYYSYLTSRKYSFIKTKA